VPRNEDGEFELILGNRQLLSVFFIIVILLGVFFTMGYIVGRNSAPLTEVASSKQEAKPLVVESPSRQPEAPKKEAPPAAAPTETAAQQPETKKEAESVKEPPAKKEPAKAETKAKREAEKPAASGSEPVVGASYLQLAATDKDKADIMVDMLRKKKFPSMAAEIPEKAGLFRVLVGPLPEGALNKTKVDLQDAGFPGNKAIRKVF
jgi:cell division septation protein DedD